MGNKQKNIKALIFDVDGTLAETEDFHRKAFNEAFKKKKISWQWDPFIYKKLLKITGGRERVQYYHKNFSQGKRSLTSKDVIEICTQKDIFYKNFINKGNLELRFGIKKLLEIAKKNKKILAISSSSNHRNICNLLNLCFKQQANDIFSFIAAGDMVENKKPSPELYELVLSNLELLPEECLSFEDSNIGLTSAKSANITTVVSPSLYSQGEKFSEADYLLQSFSFRHFPHSLQKLIIA
ncbi:HAD-IA family hydrolase [Paracoccaceae bacterium]|nr:HAD-IA family hydrolase [Paracoccaceae bacterium]